LLFVGGEEDGVYVGCGVGVGVLGKGEEVGNNGLVDFGRPTSTISFELN
jgi:hypothetical protein